MCPFQVQPLCGQGWRVPKNSDLYPKSPQCFTLNRNVCIFVHPCRPFERNHSALTNSLKWGQNSTIILFCIHNLFVYIQNHLCISKPYFLYSILVFHIQTLPFISKLYLVYPTHTPCSETQFFIFKPSSRNGSNGLGAGGETCSGWWERFEGRAGNGLRGRGRAHSILFYIFLNFVL